MSSGAEHKALNCLNCSAPLTGNFCNNCGQRSTTHRLSIVHFFAHDFLHGFFHVDKGILYTLREIFIRPGKTALDYISGKRIRHFNFFSLLLLSIAFTLWLYHLVEQHPQGVATAGDNAVAALVPYIKPILFALIPLLALSTFIYFRKLKLNYTEHLVPAIIVLVICITTDGLSALLDWVFHVDYLSQYVQPAATFFYLFYTYSQFAASRYTSLGFAWRSFAAVASFLAVAIISISMFAKLHK